MPKIELKHKIITNLKPSKSYQVDYCDTKVQGLRLRLAQSGVKTFSFSYSFGSQKRRLTLGRFPILTLREVL